MKNHYVISEIKVLKTQKKQLKRIYLETNIRIHYTVSQKSIGAEQIFKHFKK